MSNQNGDNGVGMGAALVFALAWIAFVFAYAVFAFIALVISALAVVAIFRPVRLGKYTLEGDEAKAFLFRGICGGIFFPIFLAFVELMFNIAFRGDLWMHYVMIGYCLGSIGGEVMIAQQGEYGQHKTGIVTVLPPEQPARPISTIEARPSASPAPDAQAQPEPFRFATWDDEEELRK